MKAAQRRSEIQEVYINFQSYNWTKPPYVKYNGMYYDREIESNLSPRQEKILNLYLRGFTHEAIARYIGISKERIRQIIGKTERVMKFHLELRENAQREIIFCCWIPNKYNAPI